VESLRDEIIDRRDRLFEENQVSRHDCTGLLWKDDAWVSKYSRLLFKASQAAGLLKGYSAFTSEQNCPGMIWNGKVLPEYADDVTAHPILDFLRQNGSGTKVPTGDGSLPSPKDQRPRGATPNAIYDDQGQPCHKKWRELLGAASFNWSRGSRTPDCKRLSPMTSTVRQQVFFTMPRQQGHFVSINMGKIPGKQYY